MRSRRNKRKSLRNKRKSFRNKRKSLRHRRKNMKGGFEIIRDGAGKITDIKYSEDEEANIAAILLANMGTGNLTPHEIYIFLENNGMADSMLRAGMNPNDKNQQYQVLQKIISMYGR